MTPDQQRVLDRLYALESDAVRAQRFDDAWVTPARLASALDQGDPLRDNPAAVRRVLESLWVARKVLQVPDPGGVTGELLPVELVDRDLHGPGEQRLALDPDDCRGPGGSGWEEVAVFDPTVPVRYRSRVAEIARLLGQNYQRFNMAPATGLIRYVRRPQERPDFDHPVGNLAGQLASEFQSGRIEAIGPGGPATFALDPQVDRERLSHAIEAVLGAFTDLLRSSPNDPEPSLAEFQVRSLRATLAGLYCPDYRHRADAHVITAGVGSGKTYAFQLGALIHVAYRAIAGEAGLRVLLLYPRVVLAANQFQDLAQLVAGVSARLGVLLRPPLLDAGGQLPGQLGYAPDGAGRLFNSIRDAYGGSYQILISNLDTLANRLAHPEAYRGFSALDLVVLDEVHVLRGLYGAHARMLLKRLGLIRAVGLVRRAEPKAAFERVLDLAAAVPAPYLVAASATVAEPARHTARVFDLSDPGRVAHIGVGRSVSTGWVHHLFLRQRPEVSSMSAVTNATACLIHNRRDGLFREYYRRTRPADNGRIPLALSDLPNPCQPAKEVGLRDTELIHKTIGFCDSLDGVGRWASLVADNERTKGDAMGSSPSLAALGRAYFLRFQEPLWRTIHQADYGTGVKKWERDLWSHYGKLCRDCKRGCKTRIERMPPGLNAAGRKGVDSLWDLTPNNEGSYLARLGVQKDYRAASWFEPVRRAAAGDTIGNLDECGFFRAGLCWWWSMDHLGTNHPEPATAASPVAGYKMPRTHPQSRYHAVNAIRVRSFTSANNFDAFAAPSINDLFRDDVRRVFRDWNLPQDATENVALLIASPRIEVGVDLDRVTDGITYRALRDPASVQQKAGRVGRELGSDCVVVHLVTENARDHYYFRNPLIALDPTYLQPVPLHENNRIVARQHLFMAILDFLALQGANSDGQRVPGAGDRLLLINDQRNSPRPQIATFYGWDEKVNGAWEYLFGNHPRQPRNLDNLRAYLRLLGATASEMENPAEAALLQPADAPACRPVGAVDVFRHDFGSGLFRATVTDQRGRTWTVAQLCAYPREAPPLTAQAGVPRRDALVESLRELEGFRDRSYLHNILKLPVFRRGIPAGRVPGNQPFLWAPTLFEAVGNETVCINQERQNRQGQRYPHPIAYESASLVLGLLVPGTFTYRYDPTPYKVPVSRNGAQGLRNIAYRLEAVLLQVDNPEYFDPAAGCPPLNTPDLPPDFPGTGHPVPVFTPRQVSLIRSVDEPQVSPVSGLVADGDAAPTGPNNITLPQPPRTFPLRWFRVTASDRAGPIPCRLQQRYRGSGGEPVPRQPWPAVCSLFRDVWFDPALEVTEFVWGLDQQFTSRQVDPARLVYRSGGDPPANRPVALGRHFAAPGLSFELDLSPESALDRFLDEAVTEVDSAAHQTLLLQVLHAYLAEHARTPLQGGAPWEDPSRPSVFTVRNLRTLVVFHLLHRWHPPAGANQPPPDRPRFTLGDLRGCFTAGHPLFIDHDRFGRLCDWVAMAQNPESPGQRRDTLAGYWPNFESACAAAERLDQALVKTTARDLLLNTLGLTVHAAALRLTGAEEHDLAYFYRSEEGGRAFVYLFDTDDLGNGTSDVVRDLFFVSPVERALDARRRALGDTPDPPPSIDFVRCLEEELGECPASQAAHLAYHGEPPGNPALADLDPAARGERQTAGQLFDFMRTQLASTSFDHTAFMHACPEFLAHLGGYPVHEERCLVGTPELPSFQALETAAGYCLSGCVSCVVSPEQNLRGILTARETVNKLLLDACYRRVVCEAAGATYPAPGASRTTSWDTLPAMVASALGSPTGSLEFGVTVPTPVGLQTLLVVPAAVPAGWDRVFRTEWNPAPAPTARIRPRMVW